MIANCVPGVMSNSLEIFKGRGILPELSTRVTSIFVRPR